MDIHLIKRYDFYQPHQPPQSFFLTHRCTFTVHFVCRVKKCFWVNWRNKSDLFRLQISVSEKTRHVMPEITSSSPELRFKVVFVKKKKKRCKTHINRFFFPPHVVHSVIITQTLWTEDGCTRPPARWPVKKIVPPWNSSEPARWIILLPGRDLWKETLLLSVFFKSSSMVSERRQLMFSGWTVPLTEAAVEVKKTLRGIWIRHVFTLKEAKRTELIRLSWQAAQTNTQRV